MSRRAFQEQIDWVEAFVTEEVEPLDYYIAGGVDASGERLGGLPGALTLTGITQHTPSANLGGG